MNASQPTNELSRSRAAVAARAVLVVVLVASQCLIWWPPAESGEPLANDSPQSLVVTVGEGVQYGVATVSLQGGMPTSAEAAAEDLAQRIAGSASRLIELRVSGGVRQGQLDLLRHAILEATGERQVHVSVTVVATDAIPNMGRDEPHRQDDLSKEARQQ